MNKGFQGVRILIRGSVNRESEARPGATTLIVAVEIN